MAKNANFVSHKKSKLKDNGGPKLPLAADLVEGEIAINFGKDVETLSIKNESGDVVTFSSDNYYTEKKLGSGFTGENSANTVTSVIESVELWVSGTGVNTVVQKGGGNTASGNYSVAEGNGTSATSYSSHAEGDGTTASGDRSHAEGERTSATSYDSHAEGCWTLASGSMSHAEGLNTIASGSYSHTEGNNTSATSQSSHAEGNNTTASGYSSHAEGDGTTASGIRSHAEGDSTTANGESSHAEGYNTSASGTQSHAEGSNTVASGNSSHAEGGYTVASGDRSHAEGTGSNAIGESSHAEGAGTTASGIYSHAEGAGTTASGAQSHSEGAGTAASGAQSHSEGASTTASGNYSHAEGNYTITNNQSEHASGQYNVSNSATTTFGDSGNTLFSVGNGTAGDARHNAFEIRQNGDIYIVSGNSDIKLQDYIGGGGSITVDQDFSNTASTNPISTKAVYSAITDNELVWTNAYVTLSGAVSSHTANNDIHVTAADKTAWNAKQDALIINSVIDSTTSASTDPAKTSAIYDFVTGYTPQITVDQVIDSGTSASTNAVATKAVYDFITNDFYTKEEVDNGDEAISSALNDLNTRKADASAVTDAISAATSGKSDTNHTHEASGVTAFTSYQIAASSASVLTTDSLLQVIGKLEKRIALLESAIGGMTFVKLTSQQYADLTVKDPNTLYIIND